MLEALQKQDKNSSDSMRCFLFLQRKRSVNEFIKSGEIFTGKQHEAMKNQFLDEQSLNNECCTVGRASPHTHQPCCCVQWKLLRRASPRTQDLQDQTQLKENLEPG